MCQKARTLFDEVLICFPCNYMSTPQRYILFFHLASVINQIIPSVKNWRQNYDKSHIQVAVGSRNFPLLLVQRDVSGNASDRDAIHYLNTGA